MDNYPIARRTLLKTILAGSGSIVAASFLPGRWLKPVVRMGVLPAHAQSSDPTCSAGTFGMTVLVTPTTEVQLITIITTPSSMIGQNITWQFNSLPTFSGGVTFVNDPPDKPLPLTSGTGSVTDLGSYGYGFTVLTVTGGAAPYITGTPATMSAGVSFTTPDDSTCLQSFNNITVGTVSP
jgi:hypothetical protein